MVVRITPAEFAEKHARRLKASIEDIRIGLSRVSVAPTALAAAKQDKMIAELTRAVQSGKWAARLKSVSLEQWKTAAIEKGLPRIASWVDGATAKQVDFATQLFAFENTVLTKVNAMPDLTIEDSINRATTWIREMSKFVRR